MRISGVRVSMLLLMAAGLVPVAGAQSAVGKTTLSTTKVTRVSVADGGSNPVFNTIFLPPDLPDADLVTARRNSVANRATSNAKPSPLSVPTPKPDSISNHGAPSVEFEGLTTVDTANTNGFVTSPPDQGLCAGHGFVLEIINSSLVVFKDAGARISAPDAVNAFFGADPSSTFISDPRCYYDRATQRWFVSATNVYDSNNNYRSNLFLAVSQTSDPRGAYFVYSIDTTDDGLDGTPSDPGCSTDAPCFGDQPTLGADAYGVYLTSNEFSEFSNTFNGSQIYAISKSALEAGTATSLVHIGDIPLAEGIAYSVQPASSPDLSDEDRPGVEYFLSALDFLGTLDNRIAVWAMGNTSSLASATPSVTLTDVIVRSEAYGLPPNAPQKAGPYPLGQSLGEPEELIDSDDDRMQNVVYASGHLWGGLTTIVSDGTNTNAGIAYFDVKPDLDRHGLTAKLQGQSYVSVRGNSVIYPGIGVTSDGTVAAAFTVVGDSYFPSAAYAHLTPAHSTGVNIVAMGTAPQDDFSGYPEFGGAGVARWGDYSWGVADGNALWLATEYIPGGIDPVSYFTDFGTFVFRVNLE